MPERFESHESKPVDLETAKAAKEKFMEQFEDLKELSGVGIANLDGGYGVAVRLSAEASRPIPAEIDGVPIDVRVIGKIGPL